MTVQRRVWYGVAVGGPALASETVTGVFGVLLGTRIRLHWCLGIWFGHGATAGDGEHDGGILRI